MTTNFRSLIDYIGTPVIVGDPDGRAVYANPSFESRLNVSREDLKGEALAGLLAGGARESVLRAVVPTSRFAPLTWQRNRMKRC